MCKINLNKKKISEKSFRDHHSYLDWSLDGGTLKEAAEEDANKKVAFENKMVGGQEKCEVTLI